MRQEDIQYFTEGALNELGYRLLLITFPLMLLQGIITIFPILILIVIHFISFGLLQGFIVNLLGTTASALLCFWLTRSFGGVWVERFWEKRKAKLTRILNGIQNYGILIIVVLRSTPFLPSNLISIAAALSPIKANPYIWSTIWGNISMIWLLSLLSAPLWIDSSLFWPYLWTYAIYLAVVFSYYGFRYRYSNREPDPIEGQESLKEKVL
ncbi:MAG: VTT domain-containing protein [Bacillus sp. (in: Bacteria)]|nr:VTT domain-containing protein [Bacillus sp. (in: firmicutes)]